MTTVLSPIEFDHLVQVVYDKVGGHRAECWCGWASPWCVDYATADEAAEDHRQCAGGPTSALDATLSGLLDLQDDLADAVLWLADNWSSDLPVLRACPRAKRLDGGEHVPALALVAYCDTPAELAELADLLAAPVVADDENAPVGVRCHRASRVFGRVHIEAYTEARTVTIPGP